MMDNKRKRSKGRKSGSKENQNQQKQQHMVMEELSVPQVHEPNCLCSICSKPIEFISEAISEPDGSYSHFDCVMQKIREQEHVGEGEKLSYIGHGAFAVFVKDEEGKYVIKTRIQYESKESFDAAKKYVESTKE